ncbi:MAG: phospho-N-acetylmuramoyl-pentapeptide-transferase [Gammaproteobacteria bacterium]
MIYWISQEFVPRFSALNVFGYVTVRAVLAALTAFLAGVFFGPAFIRRARKAGAQPVRDDGPQTHIAKRDTPTLGGLLMIACVFASCFLWGDWSGKYLILVSGALAVFGGIGFLDDRLKLRRGSAKGLSARAKFLLQSAAAAAALFAAVQSGVTAGHESAAIPYTKDWALPLGAGGMLALGYLAIVGSSNAVNLTDGLDGLVIVPAVMVAAGLAVYAYASGHAVFADYLGVPHLPGAHELTVFCAALGGAGLAFLWFNAHPAEIFMGDVGALGIGAALGFIAFLVRQELIYVLMCGVFVMEALSVIMQVAYFKATGGRRIFRMTPLHHHFELKGWRENQVVVRFWIIALMFVLVSLAGLKVR